MNCHPYLELFDKQLVIIVINWSNISLRKVGHAAVNIRVKRQEYCSLSFSTTFLSFLVTCLLCNTKQNREETEMHGEWAAFNQTRMQTHSKLFYFEKVKCCSFQSCFFLVQLFNQLLEFKQLALLFCIHEQNMGHHTDIMQDNRLPSLILGAITTLLVQYFNLYISLLLTTNRILILHLYIK